MRKLIAVVVPLIFAVLIAGCAKAPEQELSTAKAILDSARTAEADKYVTAEFNAAQDSLNAAIAEIEKQNTGGALTRNYDKAKAMLASASSLAKSAQAKAQTEKQRMQAEVDTLLGKTSAMITETKDLLSKAPKGKEGKAALEAIGTEISTVEASVGEAQAMKTNGDLAGAQGKLNAGIAKLDSINVELNTAIEKASVKTKKK